MIMMLLSESHLNDWSHITAELELDQLSCRLIESLHVTQTSLWIGEAVFLPNYLT